MGVSDEELLAMLRQVGEVEEEAERELAHAERDLDEPDTLDVPEQEGDPCPNCGEPAEHLGDCHVCDIQGCLPPDLWTPGMADPCLTLCVRCARSVHWACSREDAAGNPTCPTCKF